MDILTKYYSHFGDILQRVPPDTQYSLITAIYPTLVCTDMMEVPRSNTDSNLEAAVKGNLPLVFIEIMRNTNSYPLYQKLLKINLSLVSASYKWSLQVISQNIMETLIHHINPDHSIFSQNKSIKFREKIASYDCIVNDTIDIIIYLLAIYNESRKPRLKKKSLSVESVKSLHAVLHHYLKIKADKKYRTRNEIVYLILLLAESFYIPDAITSGFAQELLLLSVATEFSSQEIDKLCYYKFEGTELDMEFKKTLLLLSIKFLNIPGISSVMREVKFLQGLLRILYPADISPSIPWGPALWHEIQATTTGILPIMIPTLIEEFISCGYGKKILDVSIHFSEEMDYDSMLSCMKVLSAVTKANNLDSVDYLLKINTVPILKALITQLLERTFTQKAQTIILHALVLMHYLATSKRHDLEMDGKSLISLSLSIIFTNLTSSADTKYSNTCLLISAVNLIRECLEVSCTLRNFFIGMGGIFTILDLTEVAPLLAKTVSLSLLSDLFLHEDCVAHMLMWRGGLCQALPHEANSCDELRTSSTNVKDVWFLPLLMHIWRLEEEKLKIIRTSEGVIRDLRAPLMGKDQRLWLTSRPKTLEDTFTISEIGMSARAKIYCIISLLKFHLESKAKPFHPSFKLFVNALGRKDQVTLKLVENYPFMKTGELWIEESLKSQKDYNRTSTIDLASKRIIDWTRCVTEEQELLLLQGTNAELQTEDSAYKYIINAHRAPEYESVRKLLYQARTSNSYILKKAISSQKEEIIFSLQFPKDSKNHRTYPEKAKTTVIVPSINYQTTLDVMNASLKSNACVPKLTKICKINDTETNQD